MKEMTSEGLFDAVSSALERTAFVMVDPIDDDEASVAPASMRHARIRYSGPINGVVRLAKTFFPSLQRLPYRLYMLRRCSESHRLAAGFPPASRRLP